MSGRASQRKGRAGEIELAEAIRRHGIPVRPGRALNYGDEADIVGLPGIHCEVKRHEQLRIAAWIEQAERDAQKYCDGLPAVFFRRNREPWNVVMRFSDFMTLYKTAFYRDKAGGDNT